MSSIGSTTGSSDSYAALGLGQQLVGRSTSRGLADFLQLMTEQLKNQDPLNPLDNAQFLGQLAQFSTVQGIDKMQTAMGAMASVMESDQTLRAAGLVGRDALVEAAALALSAGAGVPGEVTAGVRQSLPQFRPRGARGRGLGAPAAAPGPVRFDFDGTDDAGNRVAAGRYGLRAVAGVGDPATADQADLLAVGVRAAVDSVSIESTGLVLNLAGLGSFPLSAIRRIG